MFFLSCQLAAAVIRHRIGVLEIGEFVGAPEVGVNLRISLDLHHLDQRFEMGAGLRISCVDRLALRIDRVEHHAFAGIGIVRDRQSPWPRLSSRPPIHAHRPSSRLMSTQLMGAVGNADIAEEYVAVQVPAFGRGAPFEGGNGGELAWLVVPRWPRGCSSPLHRFRTREERRMLRRAGTIALDDVVEEPFLPFLIRVDARRASYPAIVEPGAPSLRVENISPIYSA